jgi:hypothetical protein
MHARTQPQARPLRLGSAEVYTGTCSWTRGFEQWYPPHLRTTGAGRLAYYASRFPARGGRLDLAGGVARAGREAPCSKLPILHPNRYPAEVLIGVEVGAKLVFGDEA